MTTRKKITLGAPMEDSMGLITIEIENREGSPLLQRRLSEKIDPGPEDTEKKVTKSPERQFLDALHAIGRRPKTMKDLPQTRFGVPVWSFKHAIVDAAKFTKFDMKDIRRVLFVQQTADDLVEIFPREAPTPRREGLLHLPTKYTAPIRTSSGGAQIITRPMFEVWRATLAITFYARVITAQQVVNLVSMAGLGGVGEKRPNGKKSSGDFGMWKVIRAEADVPDLQAIDDAAGGSAGGSNGASSRKKTAKKKTAKKVAKKKGRSNAA